MPTEGSGRSGLQGEGGGKLNCCCEGDLAEDGCGMTIGAEQAGRWGWGAAAEAGRWGRAPAGVGGPGGVWAGRAVRGVGEPAQSGPGGPGCGRAGRAVRVL